MKFQNPKDIYSSNPTIFTLKNKKRTVIKIMDWGATILDVSVYIPSTNEQRSLILGTEPSKYNEQGAYMGATIGRVAGRIENAQFKLNRQTYRIPLFQNTKHSLHGGQMGFDKKRFTDLDYNQSSISLCLKSPHLDEGFPGNLNLIVNYKLTDNNEFIIEYYAKTDIETPINVTNHGYWNLDKKTCSPSDYSIKEHKLRIESDRYLELSANSIPTGNFLNVENTIMDFNKPKILKNAVEYLAETFIQNGLDHCFILKDKHSVAPVELISSDDKVKLTVNSNYPSVQVYTSNFFNKEPSLVPNVTYSNYAAICIEPGYYPNAINTPLFTEKNPTLKPGEDFNKFIQFKFETY